MKMIVFTIVFAGFLLWSSVLLVRGLRTASQARAASGWPTVNGHIVSCMLRDRSAGEGGRIYEAFPVYDYSVNGKSYRGKRLAFGYDGGDREPNEAICTALQNSASVAVRYDPNDPSNATLSSGINQSIKSTFFWGASFIFFACTMAISVWIDSRGDKSLLDTIAIQPHQPNANQIESP